MSDESGMPRPGHPDAHRCRCGRVRVGPRGALICPHCDRTADPRQPDPSELPPFAPPTTE